MVILTVFDLTLGIASGGICFMVINEKVDASSFLAIVCVKIVSMVLAIPSLVSALKPL